MKKLIIKIIISIVLIGSAVTSVILYNNYYLKKPNNSSENSSNTNQNNEFDVTIKAIDKDNNIIINDIYNNPEETLFNILNDNYKIRYSMTQQGITLYDLETIKTDFRTSYIAIYVNGSYSTRGISYIQLEDGMIIEFKETKL